MTLYSIRERRAGSTWWITANPILLDGQWGIELDTGKVKLGNGTTSWNELDYFSQADNYVLLGYGEGAEFVPANTPIGTPVFHKAPGESSGGEISPGAWHIIDLSTAAFFEPTGGSDATQTAFYVDPDVVAGVGPVYFADAETSGIDWDNGSDWQFEFTASRNAESGTNMMYVYRSLENTQSMYETFLNANIGHVDNNGTLVKRVVVGSAQGGGGEIDAWQDAVDNNWDKVFFYPIPGSTEATPQLTSAAWSQIRWRELPPGSDPDAP